MALNPLLSKTFNEGAPLDPNQLNDLRTDIVNTYNATNVLYNDTVDGTQAEGLVNWDDPYTTLSESVSGHSDWVKDEGTLETIFNYYIHKGLGLIK